LNNRNTLATIDSVSRSLLSYSRSWWNSGLRDENGLHASSPIPPSNPTTPDCILLEVAECHAPVLCSGRLPATRRVCIGVCVPRSITYLSFLPSCSVYPVYCLPSHPPPPTKLLTRKTRYHYSACLLLVSATCTIARCPLTASLEFRRTSVMDSFVLPLKRF
jgi:hypothetical protein